MESDIELDISKCKMNIEYSILTTILEKEIFFLN